jgi:hypothetical protein
MNIFATSICPIESAKYLDDKRVVKMVLETAQILSTVINLKCVNNIVVYKSTHVNHPCSVWARESVGNYHWLLSHFEALCDEYTLRYSKVHKCEQYKGLFRAAKFPKTMPKHQTRFVNCAANKSIGVSFKDVENVQSAYQQYMNVRWENDKRLPTWGGRK